MNSSGDITFTKNCISFIKILAAFQVLLGHLIEHLKLSHGGLNIRILSFFSGVPIFFIFSGYLIWLSIERSATFRQYISKRFWRIFPELWLAVIVEIISIILLYNRYNIKDLIIFTFAQGSIFQFWTPSSLRDYGCGTPNGTLWTMCVMIQFYIISWLFYKILHYKKIIVWIVVFILLVALSILGQVLFENIGIEVLIKLYAQTLIRYSWLFYFGCFIAEYKNVFLSTLSRFWYLLFAFTILLSLSGHDLAAGYKVFHAIFLGAALIGFAYRYPKMAVKADISYGIFLYHMIVVNIFIHFDLV